MSSEVGACEAIIKSIKTTSDGSFAVSFEINSDEVSIINSLVRLYGNNEKLVMLGIATRDE